MKLPIPLRNCARRILGRPDVLTDYTHSLAWLAIHAAVPITWPTPAQRGFSVALLGAEQRVAVMFDRLGGQITVWEDGGPVQPWHGVPEFAVLSEFLAGLLGLGKCSTATTLP